MNIASALQAYLEPFSYATFYPCNPSETVVNTTQPAPSAILQWQESLSSHRTYTALFTLYETTQQTEGNFFDAFCTWLQDNRNAAIYPAVSADCESEEISLVELKLMELSSDGFATYEIKLQYIYTCF